MNLKYLTLIALFVTLFTSCPSDDDVMTTPFDEPMVTAPTAVQEVDPGETGLSVTFTVVVDSELTATYQATGSNVTIANPSGTVSGSTVTINYTAGNTSGAAAIILTVTDSDGESDDATAIISVGVLETVVRVTSNITSAVTWTSDKVYVLGGRITVENGGTLTIEAGTIVKGEAGTGANATALIIARGGKLMADGRADAPIIFTSIADELSPADIAAGNFSSPNLDPDIDGLWGGVIVLGRAPSSFSTNDETSQIEGIPPSDINGLYGGTDASDNSGVIRYISIRHGGSNIGEGNEINGLTLGGVGNGTVIENVEVVANQDDGIEWFGGTVSVTNAIVWNSGDDALDSDQAWAGTMDNFIIICGPNTDHALEIDGPEGTFRDGHTFRNGSVKGHPASELGDFRDGAEGTFERIYFFGFPDPATSGGRGDFGLSNRENTTNTTDNFANGVLIFNMLEVTSPEGVALSTVFRNGTDVHATEVAAGANTVGADKSVFGWTWAAQSGQLDQF